MPKYLNLPRTAIPVCISDILCLSKSAIESGMNIRVCGRVSYYDPVKQVLKLTEPFVPANVKRATEIGDTIKTAQCADTKISGSSSSTTKSEFVMVDTCLIGSFDFPCRKGTQLLCLGELQTWGDSRLAGSDDEVQDHRGVEELVGDDCGSDSGLKTGDGGKDGGPVVKAKICKLFEDVDYGKYCQYVEIIRQKNSS